MIADFGRRCIDLGHGVEDIPFPHPDEIIPNLLILSVTEAARQYADQSDDDLRTYPEAARSGILLGRSCSRHHSASAVLCVSHIAKRITVAFNAADTISMPALPTSPPDVDSIDVLMAGQRMNILQVLIRYTAAFNQSGHPAIALPWGPAMPGGQCSVQLIGSLGSDMDLPDFAAEIEGSCPCTE